MVQPSLKLLAVVVALPVLLLSACEFLDPNPGPTAVDGTGGGKSNPIDDNFGAPTAEKGKVLYDSNCARCHGADAGGTNLYRAPIWGSVNFFDLVRTGRRAMPAFPDLDPPRVQAIELYLATLRPTPSTAESGARLFELYCESCHGAEGGGGPEFPGSIQGFSGIEPIIRNGRGDMPGFGPGQLSDANIDSLQQYLSGLLDLSSLSGQQYYEVRCAGCHGFDAAGTNKAYQVQRPVDGYARYVIRNGRPGVTFPNQMPEFAVSVLSEGQLTELLAYLNLFPEPTDGEGLYKVYCANCHGSDGQGGIVGSNIWESRDEFDKFQERVRDGEGGNNYANRAGYMPRWTAGEISDDEIRLIMAYLQTISG